MSATFDPASITAFLLIMTRLFAALTVAPPFGGSMLNLRVRVALAASVALLVTPLHTEAVPVGVADLTIAIVYQVVVGTLFGFLVQLLLTAPMVAGLMVDALAGLSAASLFDPLANTSATAGARLNQMLTAVVLIGLEGHLLIVRGVLRSYQAAPLGGLAVESVPAVLQDGVGQLMLAAVEIALPLIVALLLTELVLGLAARAAPRLNVMVVGFALKSLVFITGFALMVPLLINAIAALLDRSVRWALLLTGS
ncbi:MAG: flagellar biosynthetic protein FliR [Actinomycetota bacterium]